MFVCASVQHRSVGVEGASRVVQRTETKRVQEARSSHVHDTTHPSLQPFHPERHPGDDLSLKGGGHRKNRLTHVKERLVFVQQPPSHLSRPLRVAALVIYPCAPFIFRSLFLTLSFCALRLKQFTKGVILLSFFTLFSG